MEDNNNNETKIFVGQLAWETKRDTLRHYFEQFGEIIEANVVTDRNTGRSRGYGFVTFKEGEAAKRACEEMNPVINGRRASCNLAFIGAKQTGTWRIRPEGLVAPSPSYSSSGFVHQQQHNGQFPFPYGFSGYSQEEMYLMNYYNHYHHLYGGQQYSPYMGPFSSTMFHGFYPYYAQYNTSQSSNQPQPQAHHHHHQGFNFQYTTPPPMLQNPNLPHQQSITQPPPPPILSLPTSGALSLSSSSSTSVTTKATKTVVIAATTTNAADEVRTKDSNETITSSIKIDD